MARIYLVRHGRAAAAWNEAPDPPLDAAGRAQAAAMAAHIDERLGRPAALWTSPLLRARETAAPLAERWGVPVQTVPEVAELPSPGLALDERGAWLRELFAGRWSDTPAFVQDWRRCAVDALACCREDTVVVTHAVLVNAVVAAVTGDERVLVFRPDYCSVTVLARRAGRMVLQEQGAEAATRVL
ncbi:histidine phosphatase family protein [Aquisalimonas lutea]|uniref:histidine phosphatase family protein n=1 Tax=Aquisalimonas lutea TaxID=1327750 RepID=UPI0025B4C461|nr:histidine phosphatase family protein [Aquisalimonas lutea]MDN3518713.1 histidine phosphatase family protein [Aquisalimonas lutea]